MKSTHSAKPSSLSNRANWRLLQAAAESYLLDDEHQGSIVAGKFNRGGRGGGRFVGSFERDRVRAIQLLVAGDGSSPLDPDQPAAGRFFHTLAQAFMGDRAARQSWRLQSLTALDVLPDYEENYYGYWNDKPGGRACPARRVACLLSAARELSKGQERRPALAMGTRPGRRNRSRPAQHQREGHWPTSCSVSSARRPWPAINSANPRLKPGPKPPARYALDTLKDDETIAWLASGIKRFTLPDEFNPIKIYQAIADDPKTGARGARARRARFDLREPPPVRSGCSTI